MKNLLTVALASILFLLTGCVETDEAEYQQNLEEVADSTREQFIDEKFVYELSKFILDVEIPRGGWNYLRISSNAKLPFNTKYKYYAFSNTFVVEGNDGMTALSGYVLIDDIATGETVGSIQFYPDGELIKFVQKGVIEDFAFYSMLKEEYAESNLSE